MLLQPNGLDVFYIDESHDSQLYVVTAVTVPFLRPTAGGYRIVWNDYLEDAKQWRKRLYAEHDIPEKKELHGQKLATRRGNYKYGTRQFSRDEAISSYSSALRNLTFLDEASVMSVCGGKGQKLYGEERLSRVMYALFQRMRLQCLNRKVNAMTFFDEGHPEYRSLYRKAQVYLPTGSRNGGSTNLPLSMFVKDGNFKDSKHCNFTQIADLISYSVLQKIRIEKNAKERGIEGVAEAYSNIPRSKLNVRVSAHPSDGIKRL